MTVPIHHLHEDHPQIRAEDWRSPLVARLTDEATYADGNAVVADSFRPKDAAPAENHLALAWSGLQTDYERCTGRRLGSIRQLRWEDVDFPRSRIRWRAEHDKKGRESVIPIPSSLLSELRRFQVQLASVAGWMFPGEQKPAQPMDRHLFDKWLSVAERKAGLSKLVGGLWHPYRRKWATERKGHPIKDVAAAGGWRDVETLLTCYQQPDDETLLEVMAEPRKLREAVT